jgi:hypothetical protein
MAAVSVANTLLKYLPARKVKAGVKLSCNRFRYDKYTAVRLSGVKYVFTCRL